MNEQTKKRKSKKEKYIKDKYFEKCSGDPLYYRPKGEMMFVLSPISLPTILRLIVKILEQENWDGVNWVKTT